MSFQHPEGWKRKANHPEYLNCTVHVWWGTAGFPLPVDEQTTALALPGSGLCVSSQGSPWASQYDTQLNDHPRGPRPPWGSTWHVLLVLSGFLFLCPAQQFLWSDSPESVTFWVMRMTLLPSCRGALCPAALCPTSCGGGY